MKAENAFCVAFREKKHKTKAMTPKHVSHYAMGILLYFKMFLQNVLCFITVITKVTQMTEAEEYTNCFSAEE